MDTPNYVCEDCGWCAMAPEDHDCVPRGERMREFTSGATRDTDENKLQYEGFLSPWVLEAFAKYMHIHRKQADGKLRSADNWQKGIPQAAYMDSMWRHFMDVWKSYRLKDVTGDEQRLEELMALLFNVMGMAHEILEGRDVGEEA